MGRQAFGRREPRTNPGDLEIGIRTVSSRHCYRCDSAPFTVLVPFVPEESHSGDNIAGPDWVMDPHLVSGEGSVTGSLLKLSSMLFPPPKLGKLGY